MKRKICVVTGTRAEYGLLQWLMKQIKEDDDLELQLVVTGMHLSPEFGLTYKQIEQDGYIIDERIDMLLSSDSTQSIAKSVGLGTILFSDAYYRLNPDILVLLGDRFELLAAAQAAMIMRIPIAHIHGGEVTEGVIDEPIRHSITKMSQIHFAAAEVYRKRIIQMGEQPGKTFNVGTLGIEGINNLTLLEKDELAKSLNINSLDKFFLVTLHPTTLENSTAESQITTLIEVLDTFQDYKLIFTKTNADTDGRIINRCIDEYVSKNRHRSAVYDSMGQLRYLSAIKHSSLVVGNSSSGILEAPFLRKPTINIGIRQSGRLKAASITDCFFNKESITGAMNHALSKEMTSILDGMDMLYGSGDTSYKIKEILKGIDLKNIILKKFYDL